MKELKQALLHGTLSDITVALVNLELFMRCK